MQYLTLKQVAEILQVSPWTVRRWVKAGRLKGFLLGDRGGWRVSDEDLQAFIKELREAAPVKEATSDEG